jgi:hypothetical protein
MVRPFRHYLLAVLGVIIGLGPVTTVPAEIIEPGVTLETKIGPNGLRQYVLRVELGRFDVRVVTAAVQALGSESGGDATYNERAAKGLFLVDYLRRYRATAVMGAGYTASFSPPTPFGLVKSNGVTINPSHVTWATEGLFCSDKGRVSITASGNSAENPDFRDCFEGGPLMLLNNLPPVGVPSVQSPSSSYDRIASDPIDHSFVCIDFAGRVVLGLFPSVKLKSLVNELRKPRFRCVKAMRLDPLGLVFVREGKPNIVGKDKYLLPSVIAVIKRSTDEGLTDRTGR